MTSWRRSRILAAAALAVVAAAVGLWALLSAQGEPDEVRADVDAAEALAGTDTAGYARALEPRAFTFPEDHLSHPDFRTEWWYFTGNVEAEDGRPFAYHLTIFRNAAAPRTPRRESDWTTRQIWFAHMGVTDVEAERHHAFERFSREALGLAGSEAEPVRVWLEDWEVRGTGDELFPARLQAAEDSVALDLELAPGKGPIPQGEEGLSRKGPDPGNASYYLSWTRLPVQGTIATPEGRFQVQGEGWVDREWSTSALDEAHEGWDWFSLQLDSGRELMFYELRRRDGGADTLSKGALVEADGSHRVLSLEEVELEVMDTWSSPLDGARYPSGWRLRIPGEDLDLQVEPRLRNQEMNLSVRYWEGAVEVQGEDRGEPVEGRGFVELTGYEPTEEGPG